MGWYKTGTVSVTKNSTAVVGTGTAFLANARVGDGFRGPDGAWYEINNIASDTALSIATSYLGATVGSGIYAVMPVQGYNKDSADQLRAATKTIAEIPYTKQDKSDNLTAFSGLVGATDRLPYFTGAGALSLAVITSKARAFIARSDTAGMRAELALNPVSSTTDMTPERLVTTNWLGLGSSLAIAPAQNYNALLQPGEYVYGSGLPPTNAPTALAHFITVKGRALYPHQEARQIYDNVVWQRSARVANPTVNASDWTPWDVNVTALGALLDPATSPGGLMSSTVVSGWTVSKYANGDLIMVNPSSTIASFAANELRVIDVALPVTVLSSKPSIAIATLAPFSVYDFTAPSTWMPSPSSVRFAVKNGATVQTFNRSIFVKAMWK